MDKAIVKCDIQFNEKIIVRRGEIINAIKANQIYQLRQKKGIFSCIECDEDVVCANERIIIKEMKENQKKPYFKHKNRSLNVTNCPSRSKDKAGIRNDTINIKSQTSYYSKLIHPVDLLDISQNPSDDSHLLTDADAIKKDRYDHNSTCYLDCIFDEFYVKEKHYCQKYKKDYYQKLNQELGQMKIHLPNTKYRTNYRAAFSHANSPLKENKSRIYYGNLRCCIKCQDGFVLAFENKATKYKPHWMPLIVIIEESLVKLKYDFSTYSELVNTIRRKAYCAVFGDLVINDTHATLKLEHMSWIAFSEHFKYKPKVKIKDVSHRSCEDCATILGRHLNKKYYDEHKDSIDIDIKSGFHDQIDVISEKSVNEHINKEKESINSKVNEESSTSIGVCNNESTKKMAEITNISIDIYSENEAPSSTPSPIMANNKQQKNHTKKKNSIKTVAL